IHPADALRHADLRRTPAAGRVPGGSKEHQADAQYQRVDGQRRRTGAAAAGHRAPGVGEEKVALPIMTAEHPKTEDPPSWVASIPISRPLVSRSRRRDTGLLSCRSTSSWKWIPRRSGLGTTA